MEDGQDTIADGPPSPVEDDPSALIGVDVGGYVIDGELGHGGMGVVFSATHPVIGKRAAIKILKRSLSKNPATVERFVQEARSVNQIGHPNIVDIFAFGALPDGRNYLVMDLLEGESLRKRVKRGPLSVPDAVHVIDEIASALVAVHDKGFIHRDLKPDNVFLVRHDGKLACKLLDFGLAKLMPSSQSIARAYRTATGAQLGTPDYMSPEQLRGADTVDARTDIFALGVLAFEILVGERPRRFSDGTFALDGTSVTDAIMMKAKPPVELAQLVEAMLASDPDRRPSLAAVRAVLARVRAAVPSTSVVGLAINVPLVRPSAATPPTGAPTAVESPGGHDRAAGQAPGLRAAGGHGPTKLGIGAPAPRPSSHPLAPRRPTAPRAESRLWLFIGLALVIASAAVLAFVLAR